MAQNRDLRFEALDGLRLVCALWVMLSHFGPPPIHFTFGMFAGHALTIESMFKSVFCGTAAVVAFFIISGFCIHLPYVSGKTLAVKNFYVARLVRIGAPMIVAVTAAKVLPNGTYELDAVLWSLYSEILYYFGYPVILRVARKGGLPHLTAIAFLMALVVNLIPDDTHGYFWSNGIILTTLRGLPIWLLGCIIAQFYASSSRSPTSLRILGLAGVRQTLRVFIVLANAIALILHFLTPLHYKWSMLPFAILCALWIVAELEASASRTIFTRVAPLGRASYSLYLTHKLAIPVVAVMYSSLAGAQYWIALLCIAIILTNLMYFMVETPAHRLSRAIGRNWMKRQTDPVIT